MDQGIVARIEGWDSRPAPGGYDGLRDLAAADFSGAVSAAGAWLFMLNGRIVGVADGTLSSFDGVDATAYQSPHPALPLLFSMQEAGGDTEARYYTDDTPLSEVDGTLSQGSFTGYIELSENVLSGDYYIVYYGGRSMSVAFVGNAERLVTDEEAFERANDEVGIYEVRSVDLDVRDVPEPETPESTEEESTGTPMIEEAEPPPGEESEPSTAEAEESGPSTVGEPEAEPEATDDTGRPEESEPAADGDGTDSDAEATRVEASVEEPPEQAGGTASATPANAESPEAEPADVEPGDVATGAQAGTEGAGADPFSEEEAWRETRTIPALDPEESDTEGSETRADVDEDSRAPNPESHGRSADEGGVRALRQAIEVREERIDELERRLAEATDERDRIEEERDRLRRRVGELESRLESTGTGTAEGPKFDPREALSATDLFVRYGSKGEATLKEAHGGNAAREDVNANLRIEEHTRFEAGDVTVSGERFESFLADALEYRFVRWLVEDLLYEIQDTNARKGLRDMYDALPRIDRVEFYGEVTFTDEDGEEHEESFDVICRDRMGGPLVVADFNDARDPATGEMMSRLIERANAVGRAHETLSGAFLVTASFFAPDALETAAGATGGGLLARDSRKSFLKLSRKRGFHLCLVEARRAEFHVAVPEL